MIKLPGSFPFAPIVMLIKMVIKNGGISFVRIPLLLVYMLRFLLLEPFRLLEIMLYHKKIKFHKLTRPPIFILGYWRSGTSFFQSLMCKDPSLTSSTIFRSLFSDTFYVTEPWLKPILNFLCRIFRVPYSIQRTRLDLDFCSEADMALMPLSSENSYTWGQLFPKRFDHWLEKQILLKDEKEAGAWIEDYDYFIRKLSFYATGKHVVVKSPGDTARIQHLIKKYPDAIFIYLHRDPVSVYNSNLFFWSVLQRENSLQKISHAEIENLILNSYKQITEQYLATRQLIPEAQRLEVQFDRLVADPFTELKRVYDILKLESFPEQLIRDFLMGHQHYQPGTYRNADELREQ